MTSDRRGGAGVWLCVALIWPVIYTYLYFVVFAGQPAGQLVYLVGKIAQFSLPVAAVLWGVHPRPRFALPRGEDIKLGVASGAALGGGIAAFLLFVIVRGSLGESLSTAISEKLHGFGIDTPMKFLALAVFYSVAHSLMEEYYWRWYVFGGLDRRRPLSGAILISSAGFTAHHVIVVGEFLGSYGVLTWLASLAVGMGGALFAWLFHRTGRLYAPWISHLLIDAALMTVGYRLWAAGAG